MNILYITCGCNVANLFLPLALAFRKLYPGTENILVDPSDILHDVPERGESPAELFLQHGFKGEIIKRDDFPDLSGLGTMYKAYLFYFRLYERLRPSAVVVPYELGYAYYAVQAAKIMGIPTCHVQHSHWGPYKFDASPFQELPSNKSVLEKQRDVLKEGVKFIRRAPGYLHALPYRVYARLRKIQPHIPDIPEELLKVKDKLKGQTEFYPMDADMMAFCGPYYKRLLKEKRPEVAERLEMVGYLRGDVFLNNPVEPVETIYERYRLDTRGGLALYFFSAYRDFPPFLKLNRRHHPDDALIDAIRALRSVDGEINVLVLLHPLHHFERYRKELLGLMEKNNFDRVRIDRMHNDQFTLYRHASIVMGIQSTTLYEAMLANVPIVIQNYVLSRVYDPKLFECGATAPVFFPEHLHEQIERALTDKGFQERMFENQKMVCEDVFGPFDGKCGERTAKAIVGLINEGKQ